MDNTLSDFCTVFPVTEKIIYEQPLNERTRNFMRLEFLFAQAAYHLRGTSQWESRSTMASLLEILTIFERSDLKTETIKELERHQAALGHLQRNPQVDSQRLDEIIQELDQYSESLHKFQGPIAAGLKENEFLSSIQQRSAIAGGTCDFDLPAYHNWLQQPAERRIRDLAGWLSYFESIASAIQLILRLIRDSNPLKPVVAEQGLYQMSMDPNHPCQLVRVALNKDVSCFAEISGGRHRFSVRFMKFADAYGNTRQVTHKVPFEIGCCMI
jgi:cell division protein ZapD